MKRFAIALLALALLTAPAAAETRGGPISPDGKEMIAAYLPMNERSWNVGGSDKKGLCVYTSVTHAARFQQEEKLYGLRKYAEKRSGGSWPEKLAKDIKAVAPDVQWKQYEGKDYSVLKNVLASGRMASVDVWSGIHMLNVVHATDNWVCLLDNNGIYDDRTKQDTKLIWMTPQEFTGKKWWNGWLVVLLHPTPLERHPISGECEDVPDWTPPLLVWTSSVGRGDRRIGFLSQDGIDLGGWDYDSGCWRDYRTDKSWGPAQSTAPHTPPDWPALRKAGIHECADYGCRHVYSGQERFEVNGRVVTREVFEQCPGPNCPNPKPKPGPKPGPTPTPAPSPLADDGGKIHLTMIGDTAHKVASDLASSPYLAGWLARLVFLDLAEGDPALTIAGLPTTGFHVILQAPNAGGFSGRILQHYTTYAGPLALSQALAKLDPSAPAPPIVPVAPVTPVAPVSPVTPVTPVSPVVPVAPVVVPSPLPMPQVEAPAQSTDDLIATITGAIMALAGGASTVYSATKK